MNNTPDYLLLKQYFEGELSPEEMHLLEKQALEDPFLSEAMEGYALSGDIHHDLSILQRQLKERVAQQKHTKQIYTLSWQRLSIAAVMGLLFISASILFWMSGNQKNNQLANQTEHRTEVNNDPLLIAKSPKTKTVEETFPEIKDNEIITLDEKAIAKVERKEMLKKAVDDAAKEAVINEKEILAKNEAAEGVLDETANEPSVQAYGAPAKSALAPSAARISSQKLSDTNANLSEVTIASQKKPQIVILSKAQPIIGRNLYIKYLEEWAITIKNRGTISISFNVEANGQLSAIKVIDEKNNGNDAEVISIIKDGPQWKSTNGKLQEVLISVRFQ